MKAVQLVAHGTPGKFELRELPEPQPAPGEVVEDALLIRMRSESVDGEFPPAKDLQPFVKCYFVWEGSAPKRLEVQSPPNGFSSVVFNHADPH